jgi:hypothetical protein
MYWRYLPSVHTGTKTSAMKSYEWATFFHKDNCYQPDGSVAAEVDGEWYTIIYKVEGGYAGIQIA